MRPSVVRAKLAKNEQVLVTCLHLTDPSIYELTSLMGYDAIWMDLEHHTYTTETAVKLKPDTAPSSERTGLPLAILFSDTGHL